MIKESNLEKYYYRKVQLRPFEALDQAEKDELECSEGFREFLVRGAWTKAIWYGILLILAVVVVVTAYVVKS